jgi:hypothetical protein
MSPVTEWLVAGLPTTTKSTRLIFDRNRLAVAILELNLPLDWVWSVLQSVDHRIRYSKFILSWLVI